MTESEARRVLGVDPTAPMAHVRQAYLDLVKVWHPDRFEHDARLREKASQSLQRVNEAYAVLTRAARVFTSNTSPATIDSVVFTAVQCVGARHAADRCVRRRREPAARAGWALATEVSS